MISNKWAIDFIASFAGAQDRQISKKQAGIFEKYAETRQFNRRTIHWYGKTEEYKYHAMQYYVAGRVNYLVSVTANTDSIIAELKAEYTRLDALLDTDISDEEFDRIEAECSALWNRIMELR